jgi:hypothetical protein
MEGLSDWHAFNPDNRTTYPKVDAPVQVRYANGLHVEAMMALVSGSSWLMRTPRWLAERVAAGAVEGVDPDWCGARAGLMLAFCYG